MCYRFIIFVLLVVAIFRPGRATAIQPQEVDQSSCECPTASELSPVTFSEFTPQSTSDPQQKEASLKLLDEDSLFRTIDAARQRKAIADREITQAVQIYLLEVQLSISLLRFEEAEKTYEAALMEIPDSFAIQIGYARFNDALSRVPQAIAAYGRALELARDRNDQAAVAATLMDLGTFYIRQNRRAEARETLEEALVFYVDLAGDDSLRYADILIQIKGLLRDLPKGSGS